MSNQQDDQMSEAGIGDDTRSVTSSRAEATRSRAKLLSVRNNQIADVSKRLLQLLRVNPHEAAVLGKAIWKKKSGRIARAELPDEELRSVASALRASPAFVAGNLVPKLALQQQMQQGGASPDRTQGGGGAKPLRAVPTARAPALASWLGGGGGGSGDTGRSQATERDRTARHESLRQKRRLRLIERQQDALASKATARERQERHSRRIGGANTGRGGVVEDPHTFHPGIGGSQQQQQPTARTEMTERLHRRAATDVWAQLAAADERAAAEKEAARRASARKAAVDANSQVAQQLERKAQEAARRKSAAAKEADRVATEVAQHRQSLAQKGAADKQKARLLQAQMQQQLALANRRHATEEAEQRGEEVLAARRFEAQQLRDAERRQAQRQAALAAAAAARKENDGLLAAQRVRKQQEQADERDAAVAYAALEDRKEAARKQALKARADAVQAKLARFGENVQKETDARAADNEARATAARANAEAQAKDADARKRRRAKRRQKETVASLDQQRQERKDRAACEKAERLEQAQAWAQQAQRAEDREQRDQQARAARKVQQQQWLQQQVEEKRRAEENAYAASMSTAEAALNASVLKRVVSHNATLPGNALAGGGRALSAALSVAEKARARANEINAFERRKKEKSDLAYKNTVNRPAGQSSRDVNSGGIFGSSTHRSRSV
jgi:hypothetical protein